MTRPIILDVRTGSLLVFPSQNIAHVATPTRLCRSFTALRLRKVRLARAGEFLLGGCIVGNARWYCRNCDYAWPKESLWPTEEERLTYRLRLGRRRRRPDVFIQIIFAKLRSWCEDLIHRHIRVPLLVRYGGGAVHRVKLKEGGFEYIVRFPKAMTVGPVEALCPE